MRAPPLYAAPLATSQDAMEVKPEDTAWSELVAELGLQTDESSELKRTKTALDETKKLLEEKDEQHKVVLEENEEMRQELARLRAQVAPPAEGVPEV